MPDICLKNINNFICKDLSLDIKDGELLVLLGSNGAGKTTLLNIIAGLTEYSGSVYFGDNPIDGLPTHKRKIGYLFQDLRLFPHLTAAGNIGYGLSVNGGNRASTSFRVNELLDLMKIKHLRDRYPGSLSGGEKQRVALARALAPYPKLLFLDEPFNNVDSETARYLRSEFQIIRKKLGITTLYVTHNRTEAEEMADRIAVMDDGRIIHTGMPDEILSLINTKLPDE